eukprot:4140038-Ditylum_brightwellii.AAC.1
MKSSYGTTRLSNLFKKIIDQCNTGLKEKGQRPSFVDANREEKDKDKNKGEDKDQDKEGDNKPFYKTVKFIKGKLDFEDTEEAVKHTPTMVS